jgi:hypothetical protein
VVPRRAGEPAPRTHTPVGQAIESLEVPLFGLAKLGYLARDGEGYRLSNWLFERWLRRRLASA